jgi:DNA-binding transcriptional regulator/RsmH inhibitor MraZ
MKTSNRIRLSRPAETEESPVVDTAALGFRGAVDGRFDERNRIALPSRLRSAALGDLSIATYYVTPRAALRVLSRKEAQRIEDRMREIGSTDPDLELYRMYMDNMTGDASFDVQGRLLIGADFLELIGVDAKNRDARIIPHGDYIDIWSKQRLADFFAGNRKPISEQFREYQEVAQRLKL